ncbi:MAG: c-type cytochrome domain-containing protein [Verrucomicrobiota bacterium]
MNRPLTPSPKPVSPPGSVGRSVRRCLLVGVAGMLIGGIPLQAADPIPVQRPDRTTPVDFRREILPLMQANCLPCHNRTTTKADLLLETPADMIRGGESGTALVPGKPADSLLFKLSTHEAKPRMPPKDNKVNAVAFTPEQLGVIALWIEQGAAAGEAGAEEVRWLDAAPDLKAVYAVALSPDGQYLAAGRGNRLFLYHRPTRQTVGELVSPDIKGPRPAAQKDQVGALAFRPDGLQLASGGFEEIRLWRPTASAFRVTAEPVVSRPDTEPKRSTSGDRSLRRSDAGGVELVDADGKGVAVLDGDVRLRRGVQESTRGVAALRSVLASVQKRVEAADKEQKSQQDRLGRAREGQLKANDTLAEKQRARDKVQADLDTAVLALGLVSTNAPEAERKPLVEKSDAARKAVDAARTEIETALRKLAVAEEELRLSLNSVDLSRNEFRRWDLERSSLSNRLAEADSIRSNRLTEASSAPQPVRFDLSSDGRWVVTQTAPDRLSLWSGLTGEPVETWDAPSAIEALQIVSDSRVRIRCGSGIFERDLLPRWELQTVVADGSGKGPLEDRVGALAYSPDGRWLASGCGEPSRSGHVHLWNPADGSFQVGVTNLHSDAVFSVSFSPDSRWLASAGADRFARVVDPLSGQQVRALEGHTGHVLSVAWKDDSSTLASASADLTVKFWDAVNGEKRKQAGGVDREVTALAFLGGDQWVATGSPKELRVVNENGEKVRSLNGLGEVAYAVAVSSDGRWVAAGGEDGVVRVWDRDVEAPRVAFEAVR